MKSKIFELVSVIVGAFIGAGFVSGREVAEYFAKYGFISVFFAFLVVILFFIFVKYCLAIGNKIGKCDNILQIVFKNKYKLIQLLLIIACVINIGAMIAGCVAIGEVMQLEILKILLPTFAVMGCYIVISKRYGGISLINKLVVPVLLILIILITLLTISNSLTVTLPSTNILLTIFGGATSSIIYVLFNMLIIGVLMIQIGANYSKKEIEYSSKISSVIIGVLIALVSLSIVMSDSNVISSDMPLLVECLNISNSFAGIFAVCQFLGIFTTLISSAFLVSQVFNIKIKNYSLCIIFSLLIGIIISFIGFYNIVDYLYKFTGILSAIFFLILILNKFEKNKRNSIIKK